jgi:uncharacterized SAM-binding protein YcdF (DUF218 family)
MFLLSKIVTFVTQPLAWVLLLLVAAWLLGRHRPEAGRRLSALALVVLLIMGWQVPVDAVMKRLEDASPPPSADLNLKDYVGVVVLGGALDDTPFWQVPGRISIKDSGERMMVPVALMQRNPHLKLLFAGGEGNWRPGKLTESDRAKIFFDLMQVDASRVIYEANSRTTYENAIYSAKVPGVDIKQRWLLLTTAAHMPRSLGAFRKAGWNVTPYSVDYRTGTETQWLDYSFTGGAVKWHYALHEMVGYAMYWATGRL